ncbi:Druantia anti-phage system protein DruA [Castellaniella sp.]|uniref:Druantia anti-phage system protein DruA n=1 Tax=Castellaniella sp. TaxID=1955812 RepID=UPI002AFEFF2A|nr:Druantia anti-phage system protein DruA [Castellaniella sp.]
MKTGLVIALPSDEARLKRKVRTHFKRLGFVKAPDGTLIPPNLDKQSYRDMHAHQRDSRLADNRAWIAARSNRLIQHFASGAELDVERICPRIELVRSGTWQGDLFRFASYYWRIPISEGYGRRLRFLVWDDYHGKLMGLFALGDAVFNLRARDDFIGWDHHRRMDAMVNLMDAYALGAVPPYNMLLGGKLIASLIRSQDVVDIFQAKYHDSVGVISGKSKHAKLVAVTTTSALGRSSLYNRLKLNGQPIFQPIGSTSGWGHFHVSDELFNELREYLRSVGHHYADSHGYGQGPNYRLRLIRKAFGLLGLDPDMAKHGLVREVFFCSLATNSLQFLRGDHKHVKYDNLPTAAQMGEAAKVRWVIPRAKRMPEFQTWRSEEFLRELDGTNVHIKRKHGERVA